MLKRRGTRILPPGPAAKGKGVRDGRFIWYARTMKFERITINPEICTGKPCIRGLRFFVSRLLGLLAAGETREEILAQFPYLEPEDIDEALRYAAWLTEDEVVEFAR